MKIICKSATKRRISYFIASVALMITLELVSCTKKVTEPVGNRLQVEPRNWQAVVPFGGPGTSRLFSISVEGGSILPVSVVKKQEWLSAELNAGETPTQVNVRTVLFHSSFPGDTLPIGDYYDTVQIIVPGSVGSPFRIPVKLTVLPQLKSEPSHLFFSSASSAPPPPPKAVALHSSGGGVVTYSITSGASWLQSSSLAGALPDTVDVSVDQFGLSPGQYVSTLNITTVGTFSTSSTIACTMVVSSWLQQTTPYEHDIRGIDFVDPLNGCAVGVLPAPLGDPAEGFSLVTSDGGATWIFASSILPAPAGSIDFSDGFTGWTVGGRGFVAKTVNGGLDWTTIDVGETADLYDVFFVSADTGWIVGDLGIILKTTNGGVDWVGESLHTTIKSLSGVYFINGSEGWAVGDVGTILHTTDGGDTWNPQPPPVGHDLRGVFMRSSTLGWAVGKFGDIFHWDGIAWDIQSSNTLNELRDVFFSSDTKGLAIGFNGTVLHTTNGGLTWSNQVINVDPAKLFLCLKFLDEFHGWIAGSRGLIFYTANGGN
jgi:photosystem II stability/assembly factor-like uncharacterized protein